MDSIIDFVTPYVGGAIRTGAAFAGGFLASHGWVAGDDKTAVIGGLTALGVGGWSMLQKYLASKKLAAAKEDKADK